MATVETRRVFTDIRICRRGRAKEGEEIHILAERIDNEEAFIEELD